MGSNNPIGSDVTGLSMTFTGRDYPEVDTDAVQSSPHSAVSKPDPGFSGVEIERAHDPAKTNEKTTSFIRGNKRYHLTTTLKSGLEVYHKFTQDQWEKIADHIDSLGEGMGKDQGLQELIVNLSSESALGHTFDTGTKSSFETRAFPVGHKAMQNLISFVTPLIDVPLVSIPNKPYGSIYTERPLLPSTSSSDKEKGLKESAHQFNARHLHKLVSAVEAKNTHSIESLTADGFTRAQEHKINALEALYGPEDSPILDKIDARIQNAKNSLSHAREYGDPAQIKNAQATLDELKATKASLQNKEAMRLAVALHHSPKEHSLQKLGEKHTRTSVTNLDHCLQNAFDARLVLCEKEGLIGPDGAILLDTEEKIKKYQEISDTAALLIPHIPSDTETPSETDALINAFYAGGASLNALTARAAFGPEETTTYPVFLAAIPPQSGEPSRIHEKMRGYVEEIVYDNVSSDTNALAYSHYGAALPRREAPEVLRLLDNESEIPEVEENILAPLYDSEPSPAPPNFDLPRDLF